MNTRNFHELLKDRWAEGKFVCVGLDSEPEKVAQVVKGPNDFERVSAFNRQIIDATKDLVCAYKPNAAFYEAFSQGGGIGVLYNTIQYANRVAPNVPIILDVKRGDIGNTNAGYVKFTFGHMNADAITVAPYMGRESLQPFLDQKDKGIFILCRTSNPGAGEFQNMEVVLEDEEEGRFLEQLQCTGSVGGDLTTSLYRHVAYQVSGKWNTNGNCCLVVGATAPEELAMVRKIVLDLPILIPGVGKQGGSVEKSVKAGKNSSNTGFIINNSSGIIFASSGDDYAEAARAKTLELHDEIQKHLN